MRTMARVATHASREHRVGRHIETCRLTEVNLLNALVTALAVGFHRVRNGLGSVLDFRVAEETVFLVLRYVHFMHEFMIVELSETRRAIVALETSLARHTAIASRDIRMTLLARNFALYIRFVLERHIVDHDLVVGSVVARRATGDRLRLSSRLEVAEEAGRLGYRHVVALNDV